MFVNFCRSHSSTRLPSTTGYPFGCPSVYAPFSASVWSLCWNRYLRGIFALSDRHYGNRYRVCNDVSNLFFIKCKSFVVRLIFSAARLIVVSWWRFDFEEGERDVFSLEKLFKSEERSCTRIVFLLDFQLFSTTFCRRSAKIWWFIGWGRGDGGKMNDKQKWHVSIFFLSRKDPGTKNVIIVSSYQSK